MFTLCLFVGKIKLDSVFQERTNLNYSIVGETTSNVPLTYYNCFYSPVILWGHCSVFMLLCKCVSLIWNLMLHTQKGQDLIYMSLLHYMFVKYLVQSTVHVLNCQRISTVYSHQFISQNVHVHVCILIVLVL